MNSQLSQKKKTIERSIVLSQKSLLRNESSSTDPMRHLHTAAPQSGGRRNCAIGYFWLWRDGHMTGRNMAAMARWNELL